MRSTFAGLNTMVRGIQNNQLSLDTTGHNITNASTEGYSRQRVDSAATNYQERPSLYGGVYVGGGVDVVALNRARNIYADKQYWSENSAQNLYKTYKTNYDKVQTIFNDAKKSGVLNAMQQFYSSWVNLSDHASDAASRTAVITKGNNLVDRIKTCAKQLQSQIAAQYDEIGIQLGKLNNLTKEIAELNKNIMLAETNGGKANDLRDQRDLLVDKLSEITNVNVYEEANGQYTVVSNGMSLVQRESSLTLELSPPINNEQYGISDFSIRVVEAGGIGYVPQSGILKALSDTIVQDKGHIDQLADISATLLTTFNDVHKQGVGIDKEQTGWLNFFGQNKFKSLTGTTYDQMQYTWHVDPLTDERYMEAAGASRTVTKTAGPPAQTTVATSVTGSPDRLKSMQIINALKVSDELTAPGGQNLVAARQVVNKNTGARVVPTLSGTSSNFTYNDDWVNGTADGTIAVELSKLFNVDQATAANPKGSMNPRNTDRAISTVSINQYYNGMMSKLGADAENIDRTLKQQDDLMTQITQWRQSTSGVDWNEELTNMLKFQTGYGACSRVLTSMDEMLDKLINGTGMVGR
ncbi:flagellar hook-associated protein FlgK [Selenomonas sp. oral taxon 126]|uniref:flagellar hook-associated protein FlgK n=1 Tax=Selenomonas sp. oral taxon 126 TaxID=712528 RepID=UPI0008079425|nr:flagellar hook-associated protein FlgK [Selenomonas sp. oral taxon 126]ANR70486.1 flagellar hook-associated protein FlgK [Selenomonas sp. oral taxon 126]